MLSFFTKSTSSPSKQNSLHSELSRLDRQGLQSHQRTRYRGSTLSTAIAGVIVISSLAGCSSVAAKIDGQTGADDANSIVTSESHDTIRFALDWSPNSNHTAVFVAEALGYFEAENLNVEIIDYDNMGVPEVLDLGKADFGIVDQTAIHVNQAAGVNLVSVFQVTQTETGRIIFLPERTDIIRPSDLDGKKFGGFDSPLYAGIASAVIRGDGGEGVFEDITLNTGTYDALDSGSVDFTLSVATWEDLKIERAGGSFGTFRYQDFGMPDVHTIGIATTSEFLAQNEDTTERFIRAVQKGQEFAVMYPEDAAESFLAVVGEDIAGEEDLLKASIAMMASEGFFAHPDRQVGEASPQMWQEYGEFLISLGLLRDRDGDVIVGDFDWSGAYTNQFITK